MCAIFGIFAPQSGIAAADESVLHKMQQAMFHRGPDYQGTWSDGRLVLGHNLLRIQDLSNLSDQPMQTGDWVISFNGEIYNFEALRERLVAQGCSFRSGGDSEVVLQAIDRWGIGAVAEFDGCFAIAAYLKQTGELFLCRDRFGKKPLYYGFIQGKAYFASEIKAILAEPSFSRRPDWKALKLSLVVRLWMPGELTFFEGIRQVRPGTVLRLSPEDGSITAFLDLEPGELPTRASEDPIAEFRRLLEASVTKRLKSKAPLAAFLSGGLDSSLVCAIAAEQGAQALRTFTVSYDSGDNADLRHAVEIARLKGFSSRNVELGTSDYCVENIDRVLHHMEEPLIDLVYIPLFLNFKAASEEGYRVVLSGEGSDEAWAGYLFARRIFKGHAQELDLDGLCNQYLGEAFFAGKLRLGFLDGPEAKGLLMDYFEENLGKHGSTDRINGICRYAQSTILQNLLLQVDKLAMAHSVECRAPFVDQELFALSRSVSGAQKILDGREKYIVRMGAHGKVPDSIIARQKQGFPEPPGGLGDWIRQECLRRWPDIASSGLIRGIIDSRSLKSPNDYSNLELWILLVFQRFENVFGLKTEEPAIEKILV